MPDVSQHSDITSSSTAKAAENRVAPGEAETIQRIYARLYAEFDAQHWWPADTRFEIVLGAILTQNTRWENVRMALGNLRVAGVLTPSALAVLDEMELQELIRPAGFFRQKSATLHRFLDVLLETCAGDLSALLRGDTAEVRDRLLGIKGIGPETADSILLYAGEHAIFVIDAYTRRICSRLGLCALDVSYSSLQHMFMCSLPRDVQIYNEYHALLVQLAKRCCTKNRPVCAACPLSNMCPHP